LLARSLAGGLAVLLVALLVLPAPLHAAPEREPLTLEALQARAAAPASPNGSATIDLQAFAIDLRAENAEFRDRFYRILQQALARSPVPLGLDLRQSVIQGPLNLAKLGIAPDAETLALTEAERAKLERLRAAEEGTAEAAPQASQERSVALLRGPLDLSEAELQGPVEGNGMLFLQPIRALGTAFAGTVNWSRAHFGGELDFSRASFGETATFAHSTFFASATFRRADFQGNAHFAQAFFHQGASMAHADFGGIADWTQARWYGQADLAQTNWQDRVLFAKGRFLDEVTLAEATFEGPVTFRGARFNAPVALQGVSLFAQLDFSNAVFARGAYLNVANLAFDANKTRILGDPGAIGRAISVPTLQGNESVLRNLVFNFRSLEQVQDANWLEYQTQRLRLAQIAERWAGTPLAQRWHWKRVREAVQWLGLSVLLLLSQYGTNVGLVVSAGILGAAYFAVLFWFLDRWRRRRPAAILPGRQETACMALSFGLVSALSLLALVRSAEQPVLTLACLGAMVLPVPLLLVARLYRQGRYHDLLDVTYLVEDSSARQLRLLVVRLPIIPKFYFYRDRFTPIRCDRRWGWLNYYDFSFNNLLKLGFNDIRLRDRHLPGTVSALVWYQWGLGSLYIGLLIWTLSRTIPGLNLLLYLG